MLETEQAYPMVLDPLARQAARPVRIARAGRSPQGEAGQSSSDETGWVIASQAGDRPAFEKIVRQTARLLFSRLYLETGDAHKAEDLVQDTYLVAWRNIRQVTDPDGFRPWLFSIAASVRIDAARREGRKKRGGARPPRQAAGESPDDPMKDVPDPRPRPEESAELEERRREVLSALRSMPEEYREPISLRYLGGADYETIGRQLGISNGSLRGLLNRGLARLRQIMNTESTDE